MPRCSHKTCFAPDTSCALGNRELQKCPHWGGTASKSQEESVIDAELLPWSGGAFGATDKGFVTGCTKPITIGVIGPENAGKTTFLGAWYLLLGRGLADTGDQQFAGSYSLSGWEAVASALRWSPLQAPSFPPHTASRGGRAPGLLHLSFRCSHGRLTHYFFSDAPGEWFRKWAVNRDSSDGVGARWVSDNADAFILVADQEALAGPERGLARGTLQMLAQRLGAECKGRPVALLWTKSDVAVEDAMRSAVRSAMRSAVPDAPEFSITISEGAESTTIEDLSKVLRWVLAVQRSNVSLPDAEASTFDPLFLVGARAKANG